MNDLTLALFELFCTYPSTLNLPNTSIRERKVYPFQEKIPQKARVKNDDEIWAASDHANVLELFTSGSTLRAFGFTGKVVKEV